MGWEVFYQGTLIPTHTHSTELTSRRESNCNIIITGPVDHGLHVVLLYKLNSQPTCDLFTSSFNPHRFRYKLFFTPSHYYYNPISFVPTWPPISTSSFWSKSPTHCRLLANQRFSGSGSGRAREMPLCSIKENH